MSTDPTQPTAYIPIDLLPCPFCGAEAEFGAIGGEGDDAGGQFVQCTNAMCAASSALIFLCGDDTKPLLAERWNRRRREQSGPIAPPESRAKLVAAILTDNGLEVTPPDEGTLDDIERERWAICIEIVKRLDAMATNGT